MSALHAGFLVILRGLRLVGLLRRTATGSGPHRTGPQIDVDVLQVAIDILIVPACRHYILLAAADILSPPGDDRETGWLVHRLSWEETRVGKGVVSTSRYRW